jgi:hypothetical protein
MLDSSQFNKFTNGFPVTGGCPSYTPGFKATIAQACLPIILGTVHIHYTFLYYKFVLTPPLILGTVHIHYTFLYYKFVLTPPHYLLCYLVALGVLNHPKG